ncbi:TPA: riboflavin synthase [Candidatus Scatousia excrementigallinarum]|uniref:Riboflavin synthase n=1 Tax=Candidatus Scatousia excrementigallinarum TaxID=2840935 RepID=A0A9D1F1H3_9BACT|nr:riboflavin synthase [Candidatus Scatousia excrementigallinarum]
MFTGIVEEIGIVRGFTKKSHGADIVVKCQKVLKDTVIGDSISINGCCQTVVALDDCTFTANVSDETMKISTLGNFQSGDLVNLERALTPISRMGGHIVQGHVDCTGKFLRFEKLSDFYNLTFEIPHAESKYVVYKGSIAINGVSLTVAEINGNIFKTAIIPHTYETTTLHTLKSGDNVNIETDILGKYIEKFLSVNNNGNRLNEDFLKENGFL